MSDVKLYPDENDLKEITASHYLVGLLSDDEYKYCEEYLKTFSVADAMRDINLPARAIPIYARPHVMRYLELRKMEIRITTVTEDDVLLGIVDTIQQAKTPKPGRDRNGMLLTVMVQDLKTAMKGYEILAKHFNIVPKEDGESAKEVEPYIVQSTPLTLEEVNEFKTRANDEF